MKQFCRKCGKSFRNRQSKMECPNCDILRYNKGLKLKNKTMLNQIQDPELPEEDEEETEEETEQEE